MLCPQTHSFNEIQPIVMQSNSPPSSAVGDIINLNVSYLLQMLKLKEEQNT